MKTSARALLSTFLVISLVTAVFPIGVWLPDGAAAADKTAGFVTAEELKKAEPTEVVVKLVDEKPESEGLRIETGETPADQIARQEDLPLASQVPQESLVVLETAGQDATAVAAALEQNPAVEWAEPNHVVYADAAPAEIRGNIDAGGGFGADAPRVWPKATGQGVVVAILDTGFDLQHTDLKDNLWLNSDEICGNNEDDDKNNFIDDCHGWDFVGSNYKQAKADNDPDDPHGHGTHVAGIVAAADNGLGIVGVAPNAKLMPIKVLDDQPIPGGSLAGIIGGLRYAIDNGAEIINMSFGGGQRLAKKWKHSSMRQPPKGSFSSDRRAMPTDWWRRIIPPRIPL